ncbi:MAG: DEAD/DEAH box helicase family protein, partial [Kurthia sp.]
MIAQVIVDVSAYPVDRPFDYLVPQNMAQLIEAGCRVKVPFGHRDVLGFVVGFVDETDVPQNKLKQVSKLLDIEPVITEEMLAMSKWMTHKTLCYEIDALQVMLPSALRAKYEKNVQLLVEPNQIDPQLAAQFGQKTVVPYKKFENAQLLEVLKSSIKKQQLQTVTVVKQQGKMKSVRKFKVQDDAQQLQMINEQLSNRAKKQKQAIEWLSNHIGERFTPQELLEQAGISASVLKAIAELGVGRFIDEETYRDPFSHEVGHTKALQLTEEQSTALSDITTTMDQQKSATFLLHGVTGSGKTEVYLQAIQKAINEGKEAIVLVPEISLTPMMTERFRGRFGELVAVMHSGLSQGEKYDEWRKIQRGEVKVVVGARSAIFAPFTNVGLIILDEEHESTYKQEDTPRYHARDVAIWRSEFYNCPV